MENGLSDHFSFLQPQCLALENDHAQKVATYEEEKDSIISKL